MGKRRGTRQSSSNTNLVNLEIEGCNSNQLSTNSTGDSGGQGDVPVLVTGPVGSSVGSSCPLHDAPSTQGDRDVGHPAGSSGDEVLTDNQTLVAAMKTTLQEAVQAINTANNTLIQRSLQDNQSTMKETIHAITTANNTAHRETIQALTTANNTVHQETLQAIATASNTVRQEMTQGLADATNTARQELTEALNTISTGLSNQGIIKSTSDSQRESAPAARHPRERTPAVSAPERRRRGYSMSSDSEDERPVRRNSSTLWSQSTGSNRSRSTKLPVFTGKETWKVWFNRFSDVANRRGWGEEERLDELLPLIQGDAGEFVYGSLSPRIRADYALLTEEMENRFHVVETPRSYAAKFHRRVQRGNESVEDFSRDLKYLYDKAFGHRKAETRQEDLLRKFMEGLYDDDARFQVEYVKEPKTVDEAVEYVVSYREMHQYTGKQEAGFARNYRRSTARKTFTQSRGKGDNYLPSDSEDEECIDTIRQHKTSDTCKQQEDAKSTVNKVCEIESKVLGLLQQMMQIKSTNAVQPQPPEKDESSRSAVTQRRDIICFLCNQPNHISRNCPEISRPQNQGPPRANNPRWPQRGQNFNGASQPRSAAPNAASGHNRNLN